MDIFKNYSGTATSIIFNEKYFGFKEWCTIYLGPSLVLVLINEFKLAKELFSKDEFSGTYQPEIQNEYEISRITDDPAQLSGRIYRFVNLVRLPDYY